MMTFKPFLNPEDIAVIQTEEKNSDKNKSERLNKLKPFILLVTMSWYQLRLVLERLL